MRRSSRFSLFKFVLKRSCVLANTREALVASFLFARHYIADFGTLFSKMLFMKKLFTVFLLFIFSQTFWATTWWWYAADQLDYKYNLEDMLVELESFRDTKQVFTECTQHIVNEISLDKNNIAIVEQIYQLALKANTAYADFKAKNSSYTASMIAKGAAAYENELRLQIDQLVIQLTTWVHESDRAGDKYISCTETQDDIFLEQLKEVQTLLGKGDSSGGLRILEWIKQKLYKNSAYYADVEEIIADINQQIDAWKKAESDAQKLAAEKAIAEKERLAKLAEQKALNEQKKLELRNSSDGNYLASAGIVNQQSSEEGYRLNSDVLRQEVVGMAAKVGKFTLPEGYTCRNIFSDVTSAKPNTWACRAIEIAADNGVVSKLNKTFRPESNITRAEALAILLKAAGIQVNTWSTSSFSDVTVDWQINVINTALSYGFIDAGTNFNPNKNATRGEIFNMAKRIIESQS